jgi:uncharacterized protein (TIGR02284 family)
MAAFLTTEVLIMGRATRELDVLNELLEVTLDSVAGYQEAAANSASADLQQCFLRRARERQEVADRIANMVAKIGGQHAADGNSLGAAHRAFMNLRSRYGTDDRAMLKEVARSEHFLRSCFEDVLQDNVLSLRAHEAVRTAYGSVWAGEQAVRNSGSPSVARHQAM